MGAATGLSVGAISRYAINRLSGQPWHTGVGQMALAGGIGGAVGGLIASRFLFQNAGLATHMLVEGLSDALVSAGTQVGLNVAAGQAPLAGVGTAFAVGLTTGAVGGAVGHLAEGWSQRRALTKWKEAGIDESGALGRWQDVTDAWREAGADLVVRWGGDAFEVESVARVRYRGQPTAFGQGPRLLRARVMVDEATMAAGISLSDYVDVVRYEKGISYFDVDAQGRRIVVIGANAFGRTRAGQILEASHELVHAQQFERVLRRHGGNIQAARAEFFGHPFGSLQYALDEVIAERLALQRVERYLGNLSPQQVAASTRYIRDWRVVYRMRDIP